MKQFRMPGWDLSRLLPPCALAGGLLLSSAAVGENAGSVHISDGEFTGVAVEACPPFGDCPPAWSPGMSPAPGAPPMQPFTAPQRGPMQNQQQQQPPAGQRPSQRPEQQQSQLPQADPRSPIQPPATAGARAAQPGAMPPGFAAADTGAATASGLNQPNMIGDFFGAISSQPIILPGNQLTLQRVNIDPTTMAVTFQDVLDGNGNLVPLQAVLLEPLPGVSPGLGIPAPILVDYYRSVIEVDPMMNPGIFQTDETVFVESSNGQISGAIPNQVPPQLLQEFNDGGVFVGDPADLAGDPLTPGSGGFPTGRGPAIALPSGETADEVNVVGSPEDADDFFNERNPDPMVNGWVNQPLFNIYEALFIFAPTPGSGGGVGRQKIAENSSPIPRDRIFINHSTFTDVPLTQNGVNVYRFSPGIEQSFFEQRMSIEVRFPFASTLDSDINATGGTDTESTEFGNIVTTLKALVRQTCNSAIAVGVSMTAPTHDDLVAGFVTSNADPGFVVPLLEIENESVHVMPFIGGTNTQGRWFSQWYLQGDIDTTGSPVSIRNVVTGELEDAGEINDAPFLYASISGGYWIYQNGSRATQFVSTPGSTVKRTVYTGSTGVTGFAPLAEFHFNQSLDKGEAISNGPIQYQAPTDFSLGNLVLGGVMTFGTGGSITAAWGTPVIGQDDKQFQSEIRVMLDYEY